MRLTETSCETENEQLPGLWRDAGVYYAEVQHPAAETPIRVALHGVLTLEQARETIVALAWGSDSALVARAA